MRGVDSVCLFEQCCHGHVDFFNETAYSMFAVVTVAWESDKTWDEFAMTLPRLLSSWEQSLVRNILLGCERRHFNHLVCAVERGAIP